MKPERNKLVPGWITISAILLFLIGGCGGGTPPPSFPTKAKALAVQKRKEGPAKVAETKEPEKKGEVEYSYNPIGKPDPFRPFIQLASREGLRKAVTPLQRFEISQLKLVAIISTSQGNVALVEDATGKGYVLKKGTPIGKNDGKVVKIQQDRVVIEEVYQDIFGQTKTNEVSLSLHKVEEGGES
jgi:type IV pilus assembly protein PilP